MTGDFDSAEVSKDTTPATPGATELAGVGSHLTNVDSPPPPELQENGVPFATDTHVGSITHPNGECDSNNVHDDGTPTRKQQVRTRPRKDSGYLSPKSENENSQSDDSSISNYTGSEDEVVFTPSTLTRRCSSASQPTAVLEEEAVHKSDAQYDSSDAESVPVYTHDSCDDSDMDPSRPYTASLKLPRVARSHSLGNSVDVVSDGGEQDFLDSNKSLTTTLELSSIVTRSSAGAKSARYALQRLIYNNMVTARSDDTSLPGERFFPKDQLTRVINPQVVFRELVPKLSASHSHEQIQHYAEAVCSKTHIFLRGRWRDQSYRSIFAILVLVERSHLILSFLEDKVSDLDLPLVPIKEDGSIIGMRRRDTRPDGSPLPPLDCFDNDDWSPASLSHFDRQQWHMLAPFFSLRVNGQIKHYPLHDQHILPFIISKEDSASESHGGYAKVLMIHMHPAHHGLARDKYADRGFAVKQLLANDRKSFRKERKMLTKFSGVHGHAHIVSLLATYSHRSKYHFIFDRAQSDLLRFWETHENRFDLSHRDVLWIAEQCLGLADGLFVIHLHKTFKTRSNDSGTKVEKSDQTAPKHVKFNLQSKHASIALQFSGDEQNAIKTATNEALPCSSGNEVSGRYKIKYGRHGDINPQNILLFEDESAGPSAVPGVLRGTLKIADFGTAEMNSTFSRSGKRDVANTLTYRPPECDAADKTIRQSFDIWCLGCVYLEFATWMLGGDALVREFALKRLSRDPAFNNDKTDTYFELIWKKDERRTEARVKPSVITFVERLHRLPHCTEYLHDFLSLIMNDMLVVDSQERLSCRELRKKLRKLRKDCEAQEYAMDATQWRNGRHVKPENFLRSSEVKLSKEAQRQIARNLPFNVVT